MNVNFVLHASATIDDALSLSRMKQPSNKHARESKAEVTQEPAPPQILTSHPVGIFLKNLAHRIILRMLLSIILQDTFGMTCDMGEELRKVLKFCLCKGC